MKIVYLTPRSSFRDNLRSDTLWGLICWGIRTVYSEEKLIEFLNDYENGKPFKISSAFHYVLTDGKKELFFPKPILKPLDVNEYFEKEKIETKKERAKVIAKLKDFKKISFVDFEAFKLLLEGKLDEETFFKYTEENNPDEKRKEYRKYVNVLHNQIDRLTNTTTARKNEASLYSKTETFLKNGGLFFLTNGTDEQMDIVSGALRFLSHVGFGGDSSIGKNHFKVEIDDLVFPSVEDSNAFVSLSLYRPTENELENFVKNRHLLWYDLEVRKGKFGGHFIKQKRFWKDSLLMFKEGSVFPDLGKKHYGTNTIVLRKEENKHFNVFQYGYAFNLPIKVK